jgi:hypothetical protein
MLGILFLLYNQNVTPSFSVLLGFIFAVSRERVRPMNGTARYPVIVITDHGILSRCIPHQGVNSYDAQEGVSGLYIFHSAKPQLG